MFIAIFGILLCVVGVSLWKWQYQKNLVQRFAEREPCQIVDLLQKRFSNETIVYACAIEVWKDIATVLGVKPELLRLDDRFDKELAPPTGWEFDSHMVDVEAVIFRHAKRRGVNVDITRMYSLSDCIQQLCGIANAKQEDPPKRN